MLSTLMVGFAIGLVKPAWVGGAEPSPSLATATAACCSGSPACEPAPASLSPWPSCSDGAFGSDNCLHASLSCSVALGVIPTTPIVVAEHLVGLVEHVAFYRVGPVHLSVVGGFYLPERSVVGDVEDSVEIRERDDRRRVAVGGVPDDSRAVNLLRGGAAGDVGGG